MTLTQKRTIEASHKEHRQHAHSDQLILKYPASWWKGKWREALPAGNGIIGASVYGAIQDETIMLTHGELWHGGKVDPLPDVSHTLAETRRLIDEGEYMQASWNLTNALKESGYASRLSSPRPAGDLRLSMTLRNAFREYERRLNMATGEVSVTWRDGEVSYERTLFVSRSDHMIVYEIRADQPVMETNIYFDIHPSDNPNQAAKLNQIRETAQFKAEEDYIFYAAKNEDGQDYGAVLRVVLANGGELSAADDGKLRISGTDRALILVKLFVKSSRMLEWNRLKSELAEVDEAYGQLLEKHKKLHGELYHATSLELSEDENGIPNEQLLLDSYAGEAPNVLFQKLWAFGKYLYISATSEQGLPMPLYGLWGGDYRLMWCHYMANENIQMMNWHAPVGGLTPLMKALFRHYRSLMDTFSDNARKLYGCKGIFIPAGTTPGMGVPTQIVPVILNWTGAAGWLARHYFDYYLFTGDQEFLIEEALPFMRETAAFYEDFLVEDEQGQMKIYPSVSPENTPSNMMPGNGESLDHPMPTTINSTMDIAIVKELLSNLIEGSRASGVYLEEIPKWERLLKRMPSYEMNEEGAVKEWQHPAFHDRYNHRHLSHIYPIFPGQELAREELPELFKGFETAVNKRLIGAQTGWSLAHMSSIYARLGDGEKAVESLDILARSCLISNFFTVHNDWRDMGVSMNKIQAPVQLDANLGITNAVQEMLIYVSPRLVKVLPAIPDRWKQGRASGFHFCTGKIDFSWNLNTGQFDAVLYADRATDITLKLPEPFQSYVLSGDDVEYHASTLHDGTYHIRMKPKQQLRIHSNPSGS
ncbi:glycosyl hydrolase family 95 catalytic domain-containing protein [Marinicrinis lubricantis]|uniref:Glycoside hydrolase N-terminal domain-containing protein n=1 Tax=Marinicrinis lubricantis TaxID=2086470 RepID=A0ABW1ILB9_9BACL